MAAVIRTILSETRGNLRLLAISALFALLAAALLLLAPAAAQEDPSEFELILSLDEDSDNIVPAGSEITVNAELRFPWRLPFTPPDTLSGYTAYQLPLQIPTVSSLRIAGGLEWDSAGRQRFDIAAHTPLVRRLPPPTSSGARFQVKAFDGRTLVARSDNRQLYIYDSYTLQHVTTIEPPAGTHPHRSAGFGASQSWNTRNAGAVEGKAIDIWHETADRAWLFVGSWGDTVASRTFMGRLFRFRLDWNDAGVTVTPMGWLAPTLAEADNRHGAAIAQYGGAVSFSRDGGTLAVSASRMNVMGAVYVYSRPDGPGEDWGDLEYADGVKVTAGAVPSWGTSATNMPFLPGTAYDASNPRSCDSWCSMVWSSTNTQSYDGVELGSMRVSLSADGSVLLVGAAAKEYAVTTPGGGFVAANRRDNAGEAFVWVAPAGGWKNAPRADLDASGNAKTLIAAKTDATNFRRATHYSPGPLRRVTEPAAILAPGTWPNVGGYYFGNDAVISPDGATAAVANADGNPARGAVFIFQRDSAGDWASVNGGYLTPSATLSGVVSASNATSGVQFTPDGSELAVGQTLLSFSNTVGQFLVFSRPADGTWVSAAASTGRLLLEPADVRSNNSRFGNLIPEVSGHRVVLGTQAQHREYLANPDGCSISTVDDATSVRCPLTLPRARITIPPGTPDGPFTITGSIAVQLGSGEPLTLRDELEVTVGAVDELAQLEFAFATDTLGDSDPLNDRPYPSVVAPGGSTTLQLKLLNENGKASAKGAAASVLFSTTRGGLSARLAAAAGEACAASGGQSCRIASPATALTADNADKIQLTVTHPGAAQAGAARVRAVVVNAAGRTLRTEPITVIFAGPPTRLAIAEPPALLGYVPADSVDQRNIATLVVSASDAAGNKATVPDGRRSWKLTSPDGKAVRIRVDWPLRKGGTGDDAGELVRSEGNPQARVTILADAAAPLTEGEYTLELSVGSGAAKLTATQTFVVTGGAAALTLSADPAGEIAERDTVTLTATVTDANGEPAPDGTPVTFSEGSASGEVVLVLLNPARQLTRGGQASIELRAVNGGVGYVRAEADAASGVQTINVAAAGSVEGAVVSLTLDGFSIWTSAQPTTAAELHARLANVARISKWHGSGWYSYGRAGGQFVADSINFPINPGDTLWLDSK